MVGVVARAVAPEREEDAGQLARDGNRRDELATALLDLGRPPADGVERTQSAEVPGGLYQRSTYGRRARLGDARSLLARRAGILARRQTEEALDRVGCRKSGAVVERCNEAQAGDGSDSRHRHQAPADRVFLGELLELLVGRSDLLVESIDHPKHSLDVLRQAAGGAECCSSCALREGRHVARANLEQLSPAQPRTQLRSEVRVATSSSRIVHMLRRCRANSVGT